MVCYELTIFMSCAFPRPSLSILLQGGEPNSALQHVNPAFSTANALKSLDFGLPQT